MSTDDREIEVYRAPLYRPGDKVIARKQVKNDGTMAGFEIGDIVVKKGDVGYVRDIGVFLSQFYIYAIDFIQRGSIVGMRENEISPLDVQGMAEGERVLQSHIVTREMLAEAASIRQ